MKYRLIANDYIIEVLESANPKLSREEILKLAIRRATAREGEDIRVIKSLRGRLELEKNIKSYLSKNA